MQQIYSAMTRQQDLTAARANTFDRLIILGPLFVLYASVLSVLYRKAVQIDNWAFADWATSYAGGFVRRGLSGELLQALAVPLGSQNIAFAAINAGLYAVLFGFLAVKFLGYGRDVVRALLFLPTSVFFLLDQNLVGRKETLLFVFAVALVSTIEGRLAKARPQLYWALFGLVAAALLFFHEAMIFFYPLVFVAAQIGRKRSSTPLAAAKSFAVFIALPALAFLLIYALHAPVRLEAIFAAITDGGEILRRRCLAAPDIASWGARGALCYLNTPLSEALRQVWILTDGRDLLGTACLLGLWLAAAVGLYAHAAHLRAVAWHGTALGLALAATLPLYAISIDWGRWTFIITVLLTISTPRRLRGAWELANIKLLLLLPLFSLFTVSDRRAPRFTLAGPLAVYERVTGRPTDIDP